MLCCLTGELEATTVCLDELTIIITKMFVNFHISLHIFRQFNLNLHYFWIEAALLAIKC